METLGEAADFMVGGGQDNPSLDRENLKAADLSDEQKTDLIAFLESLDEGYELTAPELP